jgi:hypothetical protein
MRHSFSAAVTLCGSFLCLIIVSCGGGSTPTFAPTPDFSLTITPTAATLTPGAAGQMVSIAANAVNSFTGTVSVVASGLPTGVTFNPSTLTLTPGKVQTMTLAAASAAAAGTSTITLTGTSGQLSHAATFALTVSAPPPPPDFSLTVTPAVATLTAGGTGVQVSLLVAPTNSFTGTVAIAITGLLTGVTANPSPLSLAPGAAQSTTLMASGAAVAGPSTVTFSATSGSLTHSATLALTVQVKAQANIPDVSTYHYDNARDGLNAAETILTLDNVNSAQFGKIGFDTVDGKVDAEPLFIANINVGGSLRNALYVATEHDSVFAFDADSGEQLWKTSILGTGETTSDDHGCSQITPEIGITSTPVIDRKLGPDGTLFTVGMTKDTSGNYHQRLHALDLTTGAEVSGSPTEITGSYPGTADPAQNGNVMFEPAKYAERAALLLLNENIYLAWTSHCDNPPYTGWIMGYSEATLKQVQVLNVTPNGSEGSIWMSGDGMAADSSGNIYFLDANGTFDTTFDSMGFPSRGDFGNAMIKLATSGTLAVSDYFNEFNSGQESSKDIDLGSGGELLLPDLADDSGSVHHLIVGAGKDMNIYLADRDNMGKFSNSGNSNLYQEVSGQLTGLVYSTPAYFNGTLYYGAEGDKLKAFPVSNAKLATTPSSISANSFPYPGTTPGISANGTQNGIVWAVESSLSQPAVLHAFDATNVADELYNSTQAAARRDSFGNGNKFITPLVVNGKVYVGTQSGVAIFGLLSP